MKRLFTLAGMGVLPFVASAAPIFAESFDTDATANWQFNSSVGAADAANNNSGNEANFFFDYSTVGIPSAPRSVGGTTRGLKMEANVFGGTAAFSGMSASPIGQSFQGNYILRFDAWQNFQGPMPGGGNGTTQLTMAGIGVPTNEAQFPANNIDGVAFAATGDGGSGQDYRAYVAVGAPLADTSGAYAAGNAVGSTNNSNAYYSTFRGSVPTAQTTYANGQSFPNHTGNTAVGALGMAWHTWEIEKAGTTVTWRVDGKLLATVVNANPTGDNIFFGYFDSNGVASNQAISRNLLFGLVDNVQVVPEPASLSVLGLGALALLRRRRRS